MKVIVNKYSTDGSSLSEDRREQIALVCKLCESLGNASTTYKDIQNIAVENKVFGDAKADSVIRTVFPLLKKLGFVAYPENEEFAASSFFSNYGKALVKLDEALRDAQTLNNDALVEKIQRAIEELLQIGIFNMVNSEYKSHNILLALDILKQEREIYWNELLFILSLVQEGQTVSSAIEIAKSNRDNGDGYEYYNAKGNPIANTAYSYVRSFLIEAGLIPPTKGNYSQINLNSYNIVKSLPPYGN